MLHPLNKKEDIKSNTDFFKKLLEIWSIELKKYFNFGKSTQKVEPEKTKEEIIKEIKQENFLEVKDMNF